MLRMIIADDEKIIRETVSNFIDWKSLGIEVVALCENGIEAYDAIIDEYPDIVITDIKMPGLSGLELIQRITQTYDKIEFIIISGYGEFSFAAEAMKYGVKHFLLKPCNEEQIIEAIDEVKKDYCGGHAARYMQEDQKATAAALRENIIQNILIQGISSQANLDTIVNSYDQIMDFQGTGYELFSFFNVTEQILPGILRNIRSLNETRLPGLTIYKIYAKNTLLLFFESYHASDEELDAFFREFSMPVRRQIECRHEKGRNLKTLLGTVLDAIRYSDIIYFINDDDRKVFICNYDSLFRKTEDIIRKADAGDGKSRENGLDELKELLGSIGNPDFLKSIITNLLLKRSMQNSSISMAEVAEFLLQINDVQDAERICSLFYSKINCLSSDQEEESTYKYFIYKIYRCVEEHLNDPNLSLKWICENYLFMNVDYVSKQFFRQTGNRFSNYLNETRIKRAKELLLGCDPEKVYYVAEQVGCGNHPQYFSQLFKKYTGMTPSTYLKKFRNR